MLRIVTTFGITLLAVPILGIVLAMSLARDGSQELHVSSTAAAHALCVTERLNVSDAVQNGCELISSGPLIQLGFLATAGVMALLLTGYAIAARVLAHPRDRLARYFPIIIRASLVTLVLVLLCQGALVFWLLYERAIAQGPQEVSSWWVIVVWVLISLGAGLIAAASLIAWSRYSARFIPAFRSLTVSLQSVHLDERDSRGWFRAARIPAVLVLATMLDLFHGLVSKVGRERELAADMAAASVSSGTALLSAFGKISAMSAEWPDFWGALAHFITFGRTRVNFCDDLLLRAAALKGLIAPQRFARWLLESQQPHPFDSHPSVAARAAALGIDSGPIVEASIASLDKHSEASPELRALEEVLTKEITERIRVPGAALNVDSTPGLPDALARSRGRKR